MEARLVRSPRSKTLPAHCWDVRISSATGLANGATNNTCVASPHVALTRRTVDLTMALQAKGDDEVATPACFGHERKSGSPGQERLAAADPPPARAGAVHGPSVVPGGHPSPC